MGSPKSMLDISQFSILFFSGTFLETPVYFGAIDFPVMWAGFGGITILLFSLRNGAS